MFSFAKKYKIWRSNWSQQLLQYVREDLASFINCLTLPIRHRYNVILVCVFSHPNSLTPITISSSSHFQMVDNKSTHHEDKDVVDRVVDVVRWN